MADDRDDGGDPLSMTVKSNSTALLMNRVSSPTAQEEKAMKQTKTMTSLGTTAAGTMMNLTDRAMHSSTFNKITMNGAMTGSGFFK